MQLYDCKVRLAGNLVNEVHKRGVTAAEVMLLRVIHGGDAQDPSSVVELTPAKDADGKRFPLLERTDQEERARLQHLYGGALLSCEGVESVNGVFGPTGPLPQVLDGVEANLVKPGRKPRRKRVAKPVPVVPTAAPAELAVADLE